MHTFWLFSLCSCVETSQALCLKAEGYWGAQGVNQATGQPIPTSEWIDRLAPKALATMRAHTLGREAMIIGSVQLEPAGMVFLRTDIGGLRVLDMSVGDPPPPLCRPHLSPPRPHCVPPG